MLTDYHFVEQNVHFQMGFAQYKIATTSLSSSVQLNIHFKGGIGIFVVNELNLIPYSRQSFGLQNLRLVPKRG